MVTDIRSRRFHVVCVTGEGKAAEMGSCTHAIVAAKNVPL
jgi:hypothetical protein